MIQKSGEHQLLVVWNPIYWPYTFKWNIPTRCLYWEALKFDHRLDTTNGHLRWVFHLYIYIYVLNCSSFLPGSGTWINCRWLEVYPIVLWVCGFAPSGLRLLLLRPLKHHLEPVSGGEKKLGKEGVSVEWERSNTKHQIGRLYILCHDVFSLAESNELHKQVKNGLLAGHKWQETQVVIKRASFWGFGNFFLHNITYSSSTKTKTSFWLVAPMEKQQVDETLSTAFFQSDPKVVALGTRPTPPKPKKI